MLAGFRLERTDMDQRREGREAGCHRVIGGRGWLQDSRRKSFLVGDVSRGSWRRKYVRIQALRQDSGHQAGLWGLTAPCP